MIRNSVKNRSDQKQCKEKKKKKKKLKKERIGNGVYEVSSENGGDDGDTKPEYQLIRYSF